MAGSKHTEVAKEYQEEHNIVDAKKSMCSQKGFNSHGIRNR